MKKRMLITTIVMMLVLAVALTTSSLAWFSASQTTVTATGGQFTAGAVGSVANIGLAQAAGSGTWSNTVEMIHEGQPASTGLKPLCAIEELPQSLNADLGGTLASLVDVDKLNGANMLLKDGTGRQEFPLNTANPYYTSTLAEQAKAVIYAQNLDDNGTHITSINVTLKIKERSAKAADPNFYIVLSSADDTVVLRTAVISKTGGYIAYDFSTVQPEQKPLPVATVDHENNKHQGNKTIANEVNGAATITFENLDWDPTTIYAIHVYAWYEGGTLDVLTQSCSHTYDLTLEAVGTSRA